MRDYKSIFKLSLAANFIVVGLFSLMSPYAVPLQNIYYFAIFTIMWVSMSKFTFHDLVAIRRKSLVDLVDHEIVNNIYVLLIIATTYLLTAAIATMLNCLRLSDRNLLFNILLNIKITAYFITILIALNNLIMMFKKDIYKYIVVIIMLLMATVIRYDNNLPYLINIFINIFYPIFNNLDLNILIFIFLRNILFFLITRYLLISYLKDASVIKKLACLKTVFKYLIPITLIYLYASLILNGKINDPVVLVGLANLNFANFNTWGFSTINVAFISGFIIVFLLLINDVIKNIKDTLSFYQMVAIRDDNWTFKFGASVLLSAIAGLSCVLILETVLAMFISGFDLMLVINLFGFFIKVTLLINILANLALFVGLSLGINVQYIIVIILTFGICLDVLFYTNVVTFANSFKDEIIYAMAYALLLYVTYRLVKYISNKKGDIL